ncbi:hypothetical protein, partial [Actinoplanes sp. TBRC 11911]|uniref:hypothetical protein n=1 Tax=Actinoplanes sp. TBRC 11911 TaxID=2729386 RepID=UPI001B7D706A
QLSKVYETSKNAAGQTGTKAEKIHSTVDKILALWTRCHYVVANPTQRTLIPHDGIAARRWVPTWLP